jgi:tetratricopeptide (TPR) repeat protein
MAAILLPAGMMLLTFLLYLPSLKGDFLGYDDTDNVVNNALVRSLSPDLVVQYFSRAILYMYTPLTFLSYAVNYVMAGPDPYVFRFTGLLLHLLNTLLLYLVALRMFKKPVPAVIAAMLFAVHPANADTVAWISARSNLLSTLFFLLALLLYLKYLEKPRLALMAGVTLAFLFSLLSKSQGIMLPVTLLLADYLARRKFSMRIILEKLPLFLLALGFGLAAAWFRSDAGSPQSVMDYTAADRVLMACYTMPAYVVRAVAPYHLSAVYAWPVKNGNWMPLLFCLAPFFIAAVVFAVNRLKVLKRETIFGLSFFLVNILVTQVALLEDGFTANRYTYLPACGLFLAAGAFAGHFSAKPGKLKTILFTGLSVIFIVFSQMTYARSQVWMTTLGLFNDAAEKEPGSAFVFNNRGIARYSAGDGDGALADYDRAILLYPRYSGAFYNRGIIRNERKEFAGAQEDYDRAIGLNPSFASAYMARGILEMDVTQDFGRALADYDRAIVLNPSMAQAYYNRGILRLRMNQPDLACEDFHRVRRLGFDRADDLIRQFCNEGNR